MADNKSKFPDMKEIGAMSSKLFGDLKNSVCEIVEDYKKKRANDSEVKKPEEKPAPKPTKAATEKKPALNTKPKASKTSTKTKAADSDKK